MSADDAVSSLNQIEFSQLLRQVDKFLLRQASRSFQYKAAWGAVTKGV